MSAFPFGAVLFDLDGVLIDSEGLIGGLWHEVLREHGLDLPAPEVAARTVGRTFGPVLDDLRLAYGWAAPADFQERLGGRLNGALGAVQAIEGARLTLERLRAAGIPLAVASNSAQERLHLKLGAAGLANLVPHAFCPADVGGRGKPLPDLYLHAAAALDVSPADCLVVEDSAPGAAAGAAAGAQVWGLLAGGHVHPDTAAGLRAAGAARTLDSHAALREALGLG